MLDDIIVIDHFYDIVIFCIMFDCTCIFISFMKSQQIIFNTRTPLKQFISQFENIVFW